MKEFKVLLLGLGEQEKDVEGIKLTFIRSFFGDKVIFLSCGDASRSTLYSINNGINECCEVNVCVIYVVLSTTFSPAFTTPQFSHLIHGIGNAHTFLFLLILSYIIHQSLIISPINIVWTQIHHIHCKYMQFQIHGTHTIFIIGVSS